MYVQVEKTDENINQLKNVKQDTLPVTKQIRKPVLTNQYTINQRYNKDNVVVAKTSVSPEENPIQRLHANKDIPTMEEQAAILFSKDGDMDGVTAEFYGRAIEIAENLIGSEPTYNRLQTALTHVTISHDMVSGENEYKQFWSELITSSGSKDGSLIGLLRALSRQQSLKELSEPTPFQNIQNTSSIIEDHLIEVILEEEKLRTLLEKQFSAMVGLGKYNVNRHSEFHAHLLSQAGGDPYKTPLRTIFLNFQLGEQEKTQEIMKKGELKPLIVREAITLLKNSIISPPGGHHQLYAVLKKNGDEEQNTILDTIYGNLEEYADNAEGQVLKKAAGYRVVTDFLKSKRYMEIEEFDFMKPAMRDKLMGTLFVARLLDPKMAARYPVEKGIRGEWKNGGSLDDDTVFEQTDEESLYEARYDPQEIKRKLNDADSILKDLVNKRVLSKINRPRVKVDESFGHRAFQLSDHISVSVSDDIDTIVHEVGHYIEVNFPDLWFDASLLLRSRHQKSAGLNAVSGEIGAQEDIPEKKGRYQGDYAATGEYTSKIYEYSGATELVSMTMEYLSTPDKARELITKDPFQALLVLRRIQPDDPELKEIYLRYEKYLPHNDVGERQRLLGRIDKHKELLTEMNLLDHFKLQLTHIDTMSLPSLRVLEDQMEALPTGQCIMNLLDKFPDLLEIFDTELDEARNYPLYKLNQLLLSMQVRAQSL